MASQPSIPATEILIIGDSISLGATEVRGNDIAAAISPTYVDLLRQALPNVNIRVDAHVHRTTSVVREKLDSILSAGPRPKVAVVMIGGNDTDLDWRRFVLSDGKIIRNRIPFERYEANLRGIVDSLLASGIAPVLTDAPNHRFEIRGPYVSKIAGKDVSAMIARGGGQAESDKSLAQFRTSLEKVAADQKIPLVRYGRRLDTLPAADVLGQDGAHPAEGGHRVIYECMLPVLKELC